MNEILLVLAVIVFGILTVLGFEWFGSSTSHPFGWLGLGLVLFAAAFLAPYVLTRTGRRAPPA